MSRLLCVTLLALCLTALVSVSALKTDRGLSLPLNSECARECASDMECPTRCDVRCAKLSSPEAEEKCQLACRSQCLTAAAACVQGCAEEFTAQQAGEIPTPKMKERPQPRHFSLNQGYGPEKALNWAGHITVNGSEPNLKRHLWYWAFESRHKPETDPLVLWMTGGPGCSGLVALFAENGPYFVHDDLSLSLNPYSWNANATVIWIDQPVGSGFSYADAGDVGPFNEDEIADNVYEFLQGFLAQYPKFRSVPFHVTGESYAGHYIPAVGARIIAGNRAGGWPKINLHSLAIGNGLVDPKKQYAEYLPFITVQNVLPNTSLEWMAQGQQPCLDAIDTCSWNTTEGLQGCITATLTCNLGQLIPYQLSGLNVYDVREKCAVPPLCYDFSNIDRFLALPEVAEALGTHGITWQSCNRLVNLALVFAGDWWRNLAPAVSSILAAGVRVLVYSGEYDFIVNWYGTLAWVDALQWPGQQQFVHAQNTTWVVAGQEAGSARTAQGLTFLRVKDAGHMVPLDQPARSLDMLYRIFSGAPFNGGAPRMEAERGEEEPAQGHLTVDAPAVATE